ncbi:hypothetical protein [uncultured Alistipes sp.]|uniref:hypothetical protein n=1 Tax=uncultured Alistipes sp. TaxID=538949 RepID=UPI00262EFAAF|nr:hypothetical protein [uncultured Alistipes sp.]
MRYKTAGELPPFRTKIRAGFRKFSFRRPCPEIHGPISGQISPPKEVFRPAERKPIERISQFESKLRLLPTPFRMHSEADFEKI